MDDAYDGGNVAQRPRRYWSCCLWGAFSVCALVGVLLLVLVPWWERRDRPWIPGCQSHLKQLCLALPMYAAEHDDLCPPYEGWTRALQPYYKQADLPRCPAAPEVEIGYGYAEYLAGRRLSSVPRPAETYALWDSLEGSSAPAFRHSGGLNVAFADGHVEWVSPSWVFGAALDGFARSVDEAQRRK
jgi:prepilin-type processing-associated H-X9-DG protein